MNTVSILLPVHDAMPHLPMAVESLLSQDFGDFELLALDDDSGDGSGAYLDGLDDPRVRVMHLPKQGLTRILNQGLRESRGRYIARMDADDVATPDRLRRQHDFLESRRDVVAVGCQAHQIDADGRPIGPWSFSTDDTSIRYDLMRNITPLIHPGVLMRRADVEAVGGYDERFATSQDRDLWWKLAARGKLANLPETLIHYRRHAGAVTGSRTELQVATARRINLEHMRAIGVLDREEEYDAFIKVSSMVSKRSSSPPGVGELIIYGRVLARVLAHLGSAEFASRAKTEAWRVARGWASSADRRDWRAWLLVLSRLAPPPATLRLARWAAREAGGRVGRRLGRLAGVRPVRVGAADESR